MDKIIKALEEIKNINNSYEISTSSIENLQFEIKDAKVCTPIIGKFSSGKTALVNTLLGYSKNILKEDITPETAIPAEIIYSDIEDKITIIQNDGKYTSISIDDYRDYQSDARFAKSARIQLRNNFLEKIPDVMIVDMPGFESGFEIHNKAIDNYLPQSLAYIVTFPADDMIVRASVGNILKELCLNDMPICVTITKYDKKNDEFESTLSNMKENLKRFIGDKKIHYCMTSSFTGDAEELEEFLREIQEKSQTILSNKYKKNLYSILENTENYLLTILTNNSLSESELDEQEEKLQRQLSSLDSKFSKERENFDLEISECVDQIKQDVQIAMESEKNTLVTMTMNNQSINEYLNNIVRNAVTVSLKSRFIPKVEKYLKNVSKSINSEDIGNVNIYFNFDSDKINKGMSSAIVAVIGSLLLGSPLLAIISGIFMKFMGDKKREEAKRQIRMKLENEVFPQVLQEIGRGVEMTITKQISSVNNSIEDEIKIQRDTLQKAMLDIRGQINEEKSKKENITINIKKDLEKIKELKGQMQ